jgi:hypothetical protein
MIATLATLQIWKKKTTDDKWNYFAHEKQDQWKNKNSYFKIACYT